MLNHAKREHPAEASNPAQIVQIGVIQIDTVGVSEHPASPTRTLPVESIKQTPVTTCRTGIRTRNASDVCISRRELPVRLQVQVGRQCSFSLAQPPREVDHLPAVPSYLSWLTFISWAYLAFCTGSALFIVADFFRGHRQRIWIMHLVWPITALYLGPLAVLLYTSTRPLSLSGSPQPKGRFRELMKKADPTREQGAVAVSHCGAGCVLGNIIGEVTLFAVGGSVAAYVAGSDFATRVVTDFALAYVLGIFFQYFTIVRIRSRSRGKGILLAMRADTISILAFQTGVFGWMALSHFVFFTGPHRIHPNLAVFWFMMQIAMIFGWLAAYPANVWLLKKRWKEKMPTYPNLEVMESVEVIQAQSPGKIA